MNRITITRFRRFLISNYIILCLSIGFFFVVATTVISEIFLGVPTLVDASRIESKIADCLEETSSICDQWISSKNDSVFVSNLWSVETPSSWEQQGLSIYIYKKDSLLLWSNHVYSDNFNPKTLYTDNQIAEWGNNLLIINKFTHNNKTAVVVLNLYNKILGLNKYVFEDMLLDIYPATTGLDNDEYIKVDRFYVKPHIRTSIPMVINIIGCIGVILMMLGVKRFFRTITNSKNVLRVNFTFFFVVMLLAALFAIDEFPYSNTIFNRNVFSIASISITVGELLVCFSLYTLYAVYLYRIRQKLVIKYRSLNRFTQWVLLILIITFINITVVFFHYSMVKIIYHTNINIEIYKFTLIDLGTLFFYLMAAYFLTARILINKVIRTLFTNFNMSLIVFMSIINITLIILPFESALINTGYILLIFHAFFILLMPLESQIRQHYIYLSTISIFSIYVIFFSTIESNVADEKNAHNYARKLAYETSNPSEVISKFQKMTYYKIGNYKLEVKEDNSFDLQQLTRILSLNVDTTVTVGGYVHYVYHSKNSEVIVISRAEVTPLDYIAFFVYIFAALYIVVGLMLRFSGCRVFRVEISRFALRIRFVVIGIVIFTMILVVIVITINTFDNYENVQRKLINNQTQILLSSFEQYAKKDTHNSSENLLLSWFKENSDIIGRNVLIYDKQGKLISSSLTRPAYDRMNSSAYSALNWNKSHFFNRVMVNRGVTYNSAYVPIYHNNILIGYLNLIKVDKYNELALDPRFDVLVNILNILFVVVFVAVILSIVLYRMLTAPLNQLYQGMGNIASLRKIENIKGDDEIATLIKQYNRMIDYLEDSYAALARSEREGAWREMARQVAHEIKNPLTPMKLKIQMLQRAKSQGAEGLDKRIDSTLELLLEHIDLLAKIATEFSDFAKMDSTNAEPVSVLQMLSSVGELYANEQNVKVLIDDISPNLYIMADYSQISRVFINLCQNAIQAIADREDGMIIISTHYISSYVYINVSDNGAGISDMARKKIFEPHFTTKSSGSGLGLAMSRQIVINMGGTISFESDSSGTTFTVKLPIMKL